MKKYDNKKLYRLIKNNSKDFDYFQKFGYRCFGILLYAFSNWLKEECKNRKIKKVFFLARDGYIMKEAFDLINDESIESNYFYASRRSIIVPSLWKFKSIDEIFESIAFKKNIKLEIFLKKVGLEDFNISDLINKYHLRLDITYELEYFKNDKNIRKFLNELFPIIKRNSKQEWENFNKYINHMGFKGNIAIVDIGWFGTMQNSLSRIANNINLNGFYMGLVPQDGYYDSDFFHGYIFDVNNDKGLYDKFHYFINIFEFMFLAQHGSVKRFLNNDEFVELYDYEYESKEERSIAELIQKGAIQFIKDFKNYDNKNILLDKNMAIANLLSVTLNPTLKDAKKIGNLTFVDNEEQYIAKPKSIIYYLFHINKFAYDFKNSSWRIGFMKRLLKVKLPYLAINNLLRKVFLK